MVARAHHRTHGGVGETQCGGFAFKACKHIGMYVAFHRQVVRRRLQVLANGQHVDFVFAHVTHYRDDFLVGFAQADHQSGFCRHLRMA